MADSLSAAAGHLIPPHLYGRMPRAALEGNSDMRKAFGNKGQNGRRVAAAAMQGYGNLTSELENLEARVLFATTPLPPVVSISQVTPEAWEAAPLAHPGVVRLTRAGSTATALVVTLGFHGT